MRSGDRAGRRLHRERRHPDHPRSRGAPIGRRAFVGIVASPKVTIEDGGRVLLDPPMAIAVGAGIGLGVALLARLMRR